MIYDKVYDVIKDFHEKFKNMNPANYNNENDFFSAVAELQERLDVVLEDIKIDNDGEFKFIASKV